MIKNPFLHPSLEQQSSVVTTRVSHHPGPRGKSEKSENQQKRKIKKAFDIVNSEFDGCIKIRLKRTISKASIM